ncbi:MAG: Asp-tRNA(Asn)/Glu-tRNA(Gln) amidotransferase subunit GatB [Anaerolineae bacterium]|nr:Asp-tRNA(Asn)/Glu-tRNA(Gln) amidotransferase subunit GatB [Anaerolineae bacterium]
MTQYEPVIGLEVHAEMLTESKMFCACPVVDSTEAPPNTTVCPVCTAQPGVLPVINRQAVEYGIKVGLALNCTINEFNQFARKSYFYPDLPKGYQISQYEHPLASNGWLDIDVDDETRRIGITRAHLEEDTGKNIHMGSSSLVDLNRAGVPLLEIVSEPDMRSVEEVEAYARKLRAILVYLGVNHGDMSKGVLRFEANISVRPTGSDEMNTRTEIKNLNSIRSLVRASQYEIARQIKLVESGGQVIQQTMGFNEESGKTTVQRSKEYADDYRYFPEPDLPPLNIDRAWVAAIEKTLPELPDAKRERFIDELGLSVQDAGVLVADKATAEYFEAALKADVDAKTVANWVTGELFRLMNAAGVEIEQVKVTPEALVDLIKLVEAETINNNTAKEVLEAMFETGHSAGEIVKEQGLAQISDSSALEAIIEQVLEANPEPVEKYLGGKEGLFGWLVGQVMKETRGQANATVVNQIMRERLEGMRKA